MDNSKENEQGVGSQIKPETRTYYDSLGRTIAVKDARGNTNGYQYDAAGQKITELHADGATVQSIYDALGRESAKIDGNGNRTDLFYDRNNRLIQPRLAFFCFALRKIQCVGKGRTKCNH